jgi:hypothetical protein
MAVLMAMVDPETLYVQLSVLLASVPDFAAPGPLSEEAETWLARAYALVQAGGDARDIVDMKQALANFGELIYRAEAARPLLAILRRTAAVAELASPTAVRGAFIHAGDVFAAMIALGKIFKGATKDVLIVDPYMDEVALSDFALQVPENVPIRLLSDNATVKPTLRPAHDRWLKQYPTSRPLEARLAPDRTLHDRVIIIDGNAAYISTQSLNALAARSPATVIRADPETTKLKIEAYENIWRSATGL